MDLVQNLYKDRAILDKENSPKITSIAHSKLKLLSVEE